MNFGAPVFVLLIRLGHPPSDQVHFFARLAERYAGLQLAVNHVVVGMALAEFARTEGQWRPNLRGRLREKCSRRHDADDRVRLGVERDRLSDDVRITTETPLPQLVADQ